MTVEVSKLTVKVTQKSACLTVDTKSHLNRSSVLKVSCVVCTLRWAYKEDV
jgi:hypothetical protein